MNYKIKKTLLLFVAMIIVFSGVFLYQSYKKDRDKNIISNNTYIENKSITISGYNKVEYFKNNKQLIDKLISYIKTINKKEELTNVSNIKVSDQYLKKNNKLYFYLIFDDSYESLFECNYSFTSKTFNNNYEWIGDKYSNQSQSNITGYNYFRITDYKNWKIINDIGKDDMSDMSNDNP